MSHTLFEDKTSKHGLDKLRLMIRFIPVIECTERGNLDKELNKLKSYLVSQIKRGTTPQEEINLLQGFRNYFNSEPGSNDRTTAMDYLFDLKFLQ